MIEAEIYGMMLSAKIVMRPSAPPENMSNMPSMPPAFRLGGGLGFRLRLGFSRGGRGRWGGGFSSVGERLALGDRLGLGAGLLALRRNGRIGRARTGEGDAAAGLLDRRDRRLGGAGHG